MIYIQLKIYCICQCIKIVYLFKYVWVSFFCFLLCNYWVLSFFLLLRFLLSYWCSCWFLFCFFIFLLFLFSFSWLSWFSWFFFFWFLFLNLLYLRGFHILFKFFKTIHCYFSSSCNIGS